MKLVRLLVKNLRCVDSIEIKPRQLTSLIGPNNAGKSTLLRAVQILLDQQKPQPEEWRTGGEASPIEIQGDFEQLQDWEKQKPGVSSLVHDNRIRLRVLCKLDLASPGKPKVETTYEAEIPEENIDGWADKWVDLNSEIKTLAEEAGVKNGTDWRIAANKEKVKQLVRAKLPGKVTKSANASWTSEGISIAPALQQAIPQVQLIPAVRDAGEDGQPGAKTSFGLLLKAIILPAIVASAQFTNLNSAVTALDTLLKAEGAEQLPAIRELSTSLANRLSSLIDARVRLGMDPPDAEKFIGSNTILRLDDGTSTSISLQGHGLQRCLIFALLEVLAEQGARLAAAPGDNARIRSTVLLFEEPELFMHPHLLRRLKIVLEEISKRSDWQIILTTHSPIMVDVATDALSLVIHRRPLPTDPPSVKQLDHDPFEGDPIKAEERIKLRAVLDFHPTTCEAFFAKHAVLVEGDSELAVLMHKELPTLAGADLKSAKDCTIVSCAGKWTIPAIARLMVEFGIPVRIVHDLDKKKRTAKELEEAEAIDAYKANARIASIVPAAHILVNDDTLEDILWDERPSSGDKPYKAWKRVRELCEGKANLDHAPKLRDLVRFVYKPF
jgi:energy-coupling factor transporter ATP-binding protein EcfA2